MSVTTVNLSGLQALTSIFVDPTDVFKQLKYSRNWGWLALIVIFATYMLSNLAFFSTINPEWVVNEQMAAVGDLSATERAELRRIFTSFADYSGITGGILSIIAMLFCSLLLAAFYTLMGNNNKQKFEFNDWFVFVLWTQLPMLGKYLGFLLLLFMTPASELQLGLMNYSSLNQLFFGFDKAAPMYQWSEYLDVFFLGQMTLAAIGLRTWCDFSHGKAILISALPYALLFGTWLLLI